jgi:hypothetical protein
MEAMTIMGMAASQARFLGLTARKSNVEYQAQQINQQRTALVNESANLYNQMMTLDVPTPPSSSDYKKYVYTLDDSSSSYTTSDYTIENMTKTYSGIEDEYTIVLGYKEDIRKAMEETYKFSKVESTKNEKTNENNPDTYTHLFHLSNAKTQTSVKLTYNEAETNRAFRRKGGKESIWKTLQMESRNCCWPASARLP